MSYRFSQGQVAAFSEQCFSVSGPSDMSSGTTTASESLPPESVTESCPMPLSSAISKHSSLTGTPQAIREWLMSLPEGSHASRSALPESKKEPMTKGINGQPQQQSLKLLSPDSYCLKMCRESAATCQWLSETCADLGMKFQDPLSLGLTTLGRRTEENGCGYLPTMRSSLTGNVTPERCKDKFNNLESVLSRQMFPTPTRQDGENNGGPSQFKRNTPPLNAVVKTWPTPKRPTGGGMMERTTPGGGIRKLEDAVSMDCGYPIGQLNPMWVEWLMGWPVGWTDLKPLEMDRFQEWLQQHGEF